MRAMVRVGREVRVAKSGGATHQRTLATGEAKGVSSIYKEITESATPHAFSGMGVEPQYAWE